MIYHNVNILEVTMENNENQNQTEPIETSGGTVFSSPNSTYHNSSYQNSTYRKVKMKEPKTHSFGKSVVLPFFAGVLGTVVVIGTCFAVPPIREQILSSLTNSNTSSTNTSSDSTPEINTNLVSLSNYSDTGISVANKVRPSIVGIKVEYAATSFFGGTQTVSAEGSGIIITEDGYILTNKHVVNSSSGSSFYEISKASKLTVTLYGDDQTYEAKIIGTDEQTDLAVIKIDKTGLTPAELGDSDGVQVGEFCMAVGNPLGMQSSVSAGIVSAVDRQITDEDGKTFTLIQTDAAINQGNSGGALVNSKGQVIGVNTMKLSGTGVEGVGFAIPINSTKDIYSQLIEYQKVKRPYIGITGIDLTESLAKANNLVVGIYVKAVEDFSPAQKADLRIGDVIIEADGQEITTMAELNEIKNAHQIRDEMTVKVVRDGKEKDITIKLAEQP